MTSLPITGQFTEVKTMKRVLFIGLSVILSTSCGLGVQTFVKTSQSPESSYSQPYYAPDLGHPGVSIPMGTR